MALSNTLNRRVKARNEEEEDDGVFSGESASEEISGGESDSAVGSEQLDDIESDEDVQSESDDASNPDLDSIQQISFGALAKAQDSLGKRKRSNSNEESSKQQKTPLDDIRERIRAAREEKRGAKSAAPQDGSKKDKLTHRSSKHAPMIQSSKHAVSRRRTVIEPENGPKARDPRFDSMVLSHSLTQPGARGLGTATAAASKNYAFLDEYRASELSSLQGRLKKTKNTAEKEELKRTIRSLTDKKRAHDQKVAEREILAEHRRKEKELIREGKKSAPWFLKKGDVKKEMLTRRYKEMGARERQKALERRRKKVANKERKEMPWGRRGVGNDGDASGGKRRERTG